MDIAIFQSVLEQQCAEWINNDRQIAAESRYTTSRRDLCAGDAGGKVCYSLLPGCGFIVQKLPQMEAIDAPSHSSHHRVSAK